MLSRSPPHPTGWAKLRLMMVLGTSLGFASISTDVFLPALPTMQRSLGSSQNVLELVVTGYLVGFGLGPLGVAFAAYGALIGGPRILAYGLPWDSSTRGSSRASPAPRSPTSTAANGLIAANAVSGALAGFPMRAGSVSTLMGAAQYGFGGIGSVASGAFANGTPTPMALIIALCGVGTVVGAVLAHCLNANATSRGKETRARL